MNSGPRPQRCLFGVLVLLMLWLILPTGLAMAGVKLPRYIQFTVQDADGNFFPIGEAEFCTPEGDCYYADIEIGFPGHFYMDTRNLVAGQAYEVRIYDRDVAVHFEMKDWTFRPQDFDPLFDPFVQAEKFLIYPRFQGQEDGGLVYRLDTTLNPVWAERKHQPRYTGPDTLPDYPRLLTSAAVPVMLGGKFGTDLEALGGIDDVRPGISLSGNWRFHFPRHPPERDDWIGFREWGATYAQNRYEVYQIVAPGRRSDVTFHRFKFHFGFGRMTQSYTTQWSMGAQIGLGGIYDGAALLRYDGRKYTRLGGGAYAELMKRVFEKGRVDIGLKLRTEVLYYLGDKGPDDFWFGLAPSFSLGLVVY